MLPLLLSSVSENHFSSDRGPLQQFKELIAIRNDLVHPKSDAKAYYLMKQWGLISPLEPGPISQQLDITPKELIYSQTRIPKDPSSLLPEHAELVRKIVVETISELDRLLEGRLSRNNWLWVEQMSLIYPEGSLLQDIPGFNDHDKIR